MPSPILLSFLIILVVVRNGLQDHYRQVFNSNSHGFQRGPHAFQEES